MAKMLGIGSYILSFWSPLVQAFGAFSTSLASFKHEFLSICYAFERDFAIASYDFIYYVLNAAIKWWTHWVYIQTCA